MTSGRRLDLHVHSVISADGRAGVEAFVRRLAPLRLDGFALTDHNSVAGLSRLDEVARTHPEYRFLPGVEVSTLQGHLLAYGVREAPPSGRSVEETVDWVDGRAGVPVLAHPFRRVHGVGLAVASEAAVRSVEAVNGHNGPRANRRALELASQRSLGTTGGSDAHDPAELGRAWTRFPESADSADDLLNALRHGATVAEGRAATPAERFHSSLRSLALRFRRGGRPI